MAVIQPQIQQKPGGQFGEFHQAVQSFTQASDLVRGLQQIEEMKKQRQLMERQLAEQKRQYNVGKAYESMNMAIKTMGQVVQGGEAAAMEAFRPMLENLASLSPGMNNKKAKEMYNELFNNSRLSTEQMISEAVRNAMGINEFELGQALGVVQQVEQGQRSGNLTMPQQRQMPIQRTPITGMVPEQQARMDVSPPAESGIADVEPFITARQTERQLNIGTLSREPGGEATIVLSEEAKRKAPWNNMEDVFRAGGLNPAENKAAFDTFYKETIKNPENIKRLKEITGKTYDPDKNYSELYKDFNDNFFKFDEISIQFVPGTNDFNITHSEDLTTRQQEVNKENLVKLNDVLEDQSIQPARRAALIKRYQDRITTGGWREKYKALGEYLQADPQAAAKMLSVFGGAEPGKAQYSQQEVQRGIQRYIDTVYSSSTVDTRIRQDIEKLTAPEQKRLLNAQADAIESGL